MSDTLSRIELLGRTLDAAGLRHKVIAQNLANVNTPGYTRMEVAFEKELAAHLDAGNAEAARHLRPQVLPAETAATRTDGNNVTLEQEMMELNKNTLLYNAVVGLLTARLAMHRAAIAGR